ncbi:MAG: hypothetical protein ACLP5H_23135 [Desulfomonilaceae bacterium]
MGLRCRVGFCVIVSVTFITTLGCLSAVSWDGSLSDMNPSGTVQPFAPPNGLPASLLPPVPAFRPINDYLVKLAYGRTYGTSTQLDYATLEFSKRLSSYPAATIWGPAVGEVQMALLASYVFYYEGNVERVKRLDFHDGFELAWVPKGRFTFPICSIGMSPYLESGAGLSYVSETFRNSGSRWNWSFLGGFGFERCLPGNATFSLGVQWRHLCNGNMWGKGDELHNSNSGTDMIQGLASFVHRF